LASSVAVAYRVTGTALQTRAGAMIMTWKVNPGQDFVVGRAVAKDGRGAVREEDVHLF